MMDFIKTLSESNLFTSKNAFSRSTGRELAEMAYLHIIALRIMSCERVTLQQTKQYALKTINHDDFKKWKQSGTDLYHAMYALKGDAKAHNTTSEHFIKTLALDIPKLMDWLRSITSKTTMSETKAHRLFATLDNQFKVTDGSLRAIRRLAMNWPDLTVRQRQLCFTRLVQFMRNRCHQSDLFVWLTVLDRHNGLELQNACDAETEECGKATTLSRAAQRYASIREDDATTSADIAPVVMPLGAVQRRPK